MMELAGLEPATSWERCMRGWGRHGEDGTVDPIPTRAEDRDFPGRPRLSPITHQPGWMPRIPKSRVCYVADEL
jgi:hypothetical protein